MFTLISERRGQLLTLTIGGRGFCRVLLCVTLVLLGAGPLLAAPVRITVLHTNDAHGRMVPSPMEDFPGEPLLLGGGALALARAIAKVRSELAPSNGLLLVDSGDLFHGSPEGDLTKGRALVDLYDLLGYQVAALGNHELAFGVGNLRSLLKRSRMTWLAANLRAAPETGLSKLLLGSVVRKVAGVEIAIIGLTAPNGVRLNGAARTRGLSFDPLTPVLLELVARHHRAGRLVLVLSHNGSQVEAMLAPLVPDAIAIVGGHDHVVREEPGGADRTLVVQAGEHLQRLGRIDLVVGRRAGKAHLLHRSSRIINLLDGAAAKPGEPALVAQTQRFLDAQRFRSYDVTVALAARSFSRQLRRPGPTRIGALVSQAMARVTSSSVAVIHKGALRGGLPAGRLSLRDLYRVCPFGDEILRVELRAGELLRGIRRHLRAGDLDLGVSGLFLDYDVTAKVRERVGALEIGGRMLGADEITSLAVTRFTFERMVNERKLKPIKVTPTGLTPFEAMLEFLDTAPDEGAASGGLIGAVLASRGGRELQEVPEPLRSGVKRRAPPRLWSGLKLDLNQASEIQLAALPWLSEDQAALIVKRRAERSFQTINELQELLRIEKHGLARLARILKVD